jgi:hypothetical protein
LTSSARSLLDPAGLHPKVTEFSSGKLASKITNEDNERRQFAVLLLKFRNPRRAGSDAAGRKNLSGFSAYS